MFLLRNFCEKVSNSVDLWGVLCIKEEGSLKDNQAITSYIPFSSNPISRSLASPNQIKISIRWTYNKNPFKKHPILSFSQTITRRIWGSTYIGSSDENNKFGVAIVLDLGKRGRRRPLELPGLHPLLPLGLHHHYWPLLLLLPLVDPNCSSAARDERWGPQEAIIVVGFQGIGERRPGQRANGHGHLHLWKMLLLFPRSWQDEVFSVFLVSLLSSAHLNGFSLFSPITSQC